MVNPPNSIVVKMSEDDVHENLVNILGSMDRIRSESIINLEATDEQKQDYLRLTSELSSCVKAVLESNPTLNKHSALLKKLIKNDWLLNTYDPLHGGFWNDRENKFKQALSDTGIVLLRDDFKNESQAYHLLQSLKYMNVNGDRDEIYATILPVNSALNEHSLLSPEMGRFLLKRILPEKNRGLGASINIDNEDVVRTLLDSGCMYVDLPKENYQAMKKVFPRTTMMGEGNSKFTRVLQSEKEQESFMNTFDILKEYAALNLGKAEDDLNMKMSNFYGFGKKFLSGLTKATGISTESQGEKAIRKSARTGIDGKVAEIDSAPKSKGATKTQDQWIEYWNNITDGRTMASSSDYYGFFKQLYEHSQNGSDEQKKESKMILKSMQNDFTKSWLVSSTRLQYGFNSENSLEGKIIHHYNANNTAIISESTLDIPLYRGTNIMGVIGSDAGLKYLQTYFGTKDDGETIVNIMEFIGGKSRSNIKIWTADDNARSSRTDMAAFLGYDFDYFLVDGGSDHISGGRSRGVLYK